MSLEDATQNSGIVKSQLEHLAEELAHEIWTMWKRDENTICDLLIQFAEEIKRQAIEP